MARLLPPESANVGAVAKEIGVSVQTVERWREEAQSRPARGRAWTASARLEAVITAAALDDAGKSTWCREHGVYPVELEKWRLSATMALAEPEEARASPQATRADKKRIKELERELLRKDRALAETAALLVLSKKVAVIGARLKPACETAGIDLRTLQRWQATDGLVSGDGRPGAVRPIPAHALSEAERAHLLAVANEPRFASVPPARIVPMLAYEGIYLASESSFSRVLKAHGQTAHRGRAKVPRAVRPPTTHIATEPRQVWCWDMSQGIPSLRDITYLPAQVMGRWFHLYLILDLYSRTKSRRL